METIKNMSPKELLTEYYKISSKPEITIDDHIISLVRRAFPNPEGQFKTYYSEGYRDYQIYDNCYRREEIVPFLPTDIENLGVASDYIYYCRKYAKAFLEKTEGLVNDDIEMDNIKFCIDVAENTLQYNADKFYKAFGLHNMVAETCEKANVSTPEEAYDILVGTILDTERNILETYIHRGDEIKTMKEAIEFLGLPSAGEDTALELFHFWQFGGIDDSIIERLAYYNNSNDAFDYVKKEAMKKVITALTNSTPVYLNMFYLLPEDYVFRILQTAHLSKFYGWRLRSQLEESIKSELGCTVLFYSPERLHADPASRLFLDLLNEKLSLNKEYVRLRSELPELVHQLEVVSPKSEEKDELINQLKEIFGRSDDIAFDMACTLLGQENPYRKL